MRPACGAALWACLTLSHAQSVTLAQDQATQPYQDRVIEGLAVEDSADSDARNIDQTGWPRFLRLETQLGTQPFDPNRRTRVAYGLYGLIETPNHGSLSVDGNYAQGEDEGTLTLRQRALPVGDGWMANHELGLINAPTVSILRLPSRVFVPSAILQGVSAEWESAGRGLQLQGTAGRPGQLQLFPSGGFRRLEGSRTRLAAQWRLGAEQIDPLGLSFPGWTVALQNEKADGVSIDSFGFPFSSPSTALVDANSALTALRYEGGDHKIQGHFMTTTTSNLSGQRSGFWIDSEWDDGPRKHGLGAYRLDPDLTWAQLPIANNLMGVYGRTSWRTRQWSADTSLDWLRSVRNQGTSGIFATANMRWRLDRSSSFGAGGSLRSFSTLASSFYLDWRFQNTWGASGLRLDVTTGENQPTSHSLTYDQDWLTSQGWSLATSLGLAQYGADVTQGLPVDNVITSAVSFTVPLSPLSSLRGILNTEQGNVGQSRYSINVGTNWRFDSRWSLEANLTRSSGRSRTTFSLDPLAPLQSQTISTSERSFYAVLRYELQAGSRSVPLGGKATQGGGRVAGAVYFDTNRSGTQEASETGVPGVTVYLDNRYAVRTDDQGGFEFPFVATGPRTVSLRNDSLPLPWVVVDSGQTKVDVRLRETVTLSLPVQRSE